MTERRTFKRSDRLPGNTQPFAHFDTPNNLEEMRHLIDQIEKDTGLPASKIEILFNSTGVCLEKTRNGLYYIHFPED